MTNSPETIQIWNAPFAEMACVKNVLLVYLGRESTEDDLRLLTKRMDKKNPNKFSLFYNKKCLGNIRLMYGENNPDPIKVSFTPLATLN